MSPSRVDPHGLASLPQDHAQAARRAAVRKVMCHLLPMLFVGAVFAHIDRTNVSMASLQMTSDIGLSPAVYGFGVGAFFIIYALAEIPSNVGLLRFGARRWIARIMISWGLVSLSTAFVVGPISFVTNRMALAAAEAGYIPGVLAILSLWLPPEDRARVFSLFLMAIPLASILGGPLAAGFLALDGFFGLRGWQWLFLIEGLPPIILAVFIWYKLRDHPTQSEWLTTADIAILTAEGDAPKRVHLTPRAFFRSIANGRVLLFTAVLGCLGGIMHAVTFWLPQIIRGFGLSVTQTGFAVAVPYVIGAAVMFLWSSHSDRTGERRWHLAGPAAIAGIALVGSALLPGVALKLGLLTLATTCIFAGQGIFWSLVSVALKDNERAVGLAAVNAGGTLFAFLAPFAIGISKQMTGGFGAAFGILGVLGVVGGSLAFVMATKLRTANVPNTG